MQFILLEILRGIVATIIIYLLSYLIEKNSEWSLIFWMFNHKKNTFIAHGAANANALIFFIICLITLLIDLSSLQTRPDGYSFWIWLSIMLFVFIIYRKVYLVLQIKTGKIDNNLNN
jgi:hypothetical protein